MYGFVLFLMSIIHQILVQNLTQAPRAAIATPWRPLVPPTMPPDTPHTSQPSGASARGSGRSRLALATQVPSGAVGSATAALGVCDGFCTDIW